MASEAGGEQRCGTGARLRGARENKGLTVAQAAETLHLDARTLEALEAEDFAALGADVGAHAPRPDLTRIPRREPAGGAPRLVVPALLGLVGFALLALLWWLLTTPGEKPQPLAAAPPAPVAAEEATPAAPARPTQLALKFSALSWVEVSDATGRRLLQGLYAPGSARTLSGAPPLRVILGNAPAVALRVNDQAVTLAGLVRHDGSARLLIDGDGRTTPAPPRLAHGD